MFFAVERFFQCYDALPAIFAGIEPLAVALVEEHMQPGGAVKQSIGLPFPFSYLFDGHLLGKGVAIEYPEQWPRFGGEVIFDDGKNVGGIFKVGCVACEYHFEIGSG